MKSCTLLPPTSDKQTSDLIWVQLKSVRSCKMRQTRLQNRSSPRLWVDIQTICGTKRHTHCLNGNKNEKRGRCIQRNWCNFNQGVLTLINVRRNGAKQGLYTVIHIVCGFMRGQMVPLKQEVTDIMTWPTVECGCVCVYWMRVCVHVSKDTLLKWFKEIHPFLFFLVKPC